MAASVDVRRLRPSGAHGGTGAAAWMAWVAGAWGVALPGLPAAGAGGVTGELLRAHVLRLAGGLGVRVNESPFYAPGGGSRHGPAAFVERRQVDVPPVVDAEAYWTALHEAGARGDG